MLKSVVTTPSYTDILAVTYIGKDIIGQIGSLWYVNRHGKQADLNPKKHVTKNGIMQQLSFYMENFTPLLSPDHTLPFLGMINAMKNVTYINIGAVNTSNLQKLADTHPNGHTKGVPPYSNI